MSNIVAFCYYTNLQKMWNILMIYPKAISKIIIIINPNVNQIVEAVLWVLLYSGISSLTQVAIIAPAEKLNWQLQN